MSNFLKGMIKALDNGDKEKIELRPFNKDDWMAWAGAEGEEPKIAEVTIGDYEFVFITGSDGLTINMIDPECDLLGWFRLECAQGVADQFVAGLTAADVSWSGLSNIGLEWVDA